MTSTSTPTPESDHGDVQYLRHVTDLGERRPVVAHTAIFTRHGVKLIERGTAVDRRLLDRLTQHRLLPPIDECLSVEGMVTVADIKRGISDLLALSPAFAVLLPSEAAQREVLHAFDYLPLAPQLAFKLTVAREERPELWFHSLQVALVAAALAMVDRVSVGDLVDAALAGMSHDLGLLHIAPELLSEGPAMSERHRQHLYSHPLIAQLMLSRLPQIGTQVPGAVAEHHEREDGSGYPRGLRGGQIEPLGQLLAVAELVATVLTGRSALSVGKRLSIVLRLNRHKLAPRFVGHLVRLAEQAPLQPAAPTPTDIGASLGMLVRLAEAIEGWQALRIEGESHLAALLDQRMRDLEHSLAGAGIDLRTWTTITAGLDEDEQARSELLVLAAEGDWQLSAIVHEVRRRRAADAAKSSPAVDAWLDMVDRTQLLPPDTSSLDLPGGG